MARIAIVAPTGMLGNQVYDVLKDDHTLVLVARDREKLALLDRAYGGVHAHRFVPFDAKTLYEDHARGFPTEAMSPVLAQLVAAIGDVDLVVNCAGIIKPHALTDPAQTLFINGALPHLLSSAYGSKLVQITTDCVYNGINEAPYDESTPHSAVDLYGISKSLGEPTARSLVLRTSVIGPELTGHVSLIDWFRQQAGKTIKGFRTHHWNGITTRQFGKICDAIARDRGAFPDRGLFHVFGSDVSKYEMVQAFRDAYRVPVMIEPVDPPAVDRRLRTIHPLNDRLGIPSFRAMLDDLVAATERVTV
ncbi:sugar nucleotide-binding protein [Candidatus Uhrbacteria bacterium]|nr:sugar nucleotide-binding protein [Candidatus Uhrbacteria bacterium]